MGPHAEVFAKALDDTGIGDECQKSRKRNFRFGIAAAASLVLVIVSLVVPCSSQDENRSIQVSETRVTPAPLITSGPCDSASSCVDLYEKLARVDIAWPDNTETFAVLSPPH